MIRIQIILFATLKDTIGQARLPLILPDHATVALARQALSERYPAAAKHITGAIAAVNEDFAAPDTALHQDDILALFPPVSGGATDRPDYISLPDAPLNHDEIIAAITTSEVGAVCLFSGIVREKTHREGHQPHTQTLHYEAYESMALAKMQQVSREIRQRWPLVIGIAIAQRIGTLSVGQNTVLIACSSAHRDDGCFEAAHYGIDRLKEIVPVWKKEIGADGTAWVEGDYLPTPSDRADTP